MINALNVGHLRSYVALVRRPPGEINFGRPMISKEENGLVWNPTTAIGLSE